MVDRKPQSTPQADSSRDQEVAANQTIADPAGGLYNQLQILQQEVQVLRGMIEQQSHELKRLKQQRLDDYVDLDRRISAAVSSGAKVAPSVPSNAVNMQAAIDRNDDGDDTAASTSSKKTPADELKHYRTAIDLVIKEQNYDAAISTFNNHMRDYPSGRYTGNAHYWLGEIYLQKNQLEQSRQWFSKLLAKYPGHRKTLDAKFKLGKVYNMLGDKEQARSLLEEVAKSDTNAANLAKNYLKAHLSP